VLVKLDLQLVMLPRKENLHEDVKEESHYQSIKIVRVLQSCSHPTPFISRHFQLLLILAFYFLLFNFFVFILLVFSFVF